MVSFHHLGQPIGILMRACNALSVSAKALGTIHLRRRQIFTIFDTYPLPSAVFYYYPLANANVLKEDAPLISRFRYFSALPPWYPFLYGLETFLKPFYSVNKVLIKGSRVTDNNAYPRICTTIFYLI